MTTALAVANHDRMGKLLWLALIADQDGEIIAAVSALRRALASAGLDPHYVVDCFDRSAAAVVVQPPRQDRDAGHDNDWRSTAWWCWHHRDRLTERERNFISAITRYRRDISEKQHVWLNDIATMLRDAEAAC